MRASETHGAALLEPAKGDAALCCSARLERVARSRHSGQHVRVNEWHREHYGDPCRECGFDWSIGYREALTLADAIPARCEATLHGHTGAERVPELRWSAGEYMCHIVDNFRIWAERLAAAGRGTQVRLVPYDSDGLADARAYRSVPLEGALWSLQRAESDWRAAARLAEQSRAVLVHPDRGEQSVEEVVRGNVHDAVHHHWDIERSIGAT
jgi:hypothetical protein